MSTQFAKGNRRFKGGARANCGRKAAPVAQAKRDFIDGLLAQAKKAMIACLNHADPTIKFHAARWVLDQKFGKAPVRVDIKHTHDFTLELLSDDHEVVSIQQETSQLIEEAHASTTRTGPEQAAGGDDERAQGRR